MCSLRLSRRDNIVVKSYCSLGVKSRRDDIVFFLLYYIRFYSTEIDMANTYSQVHLQYIIRVRYKQALIKEEWENELYNYIAKIIIEQGHKCLEINGVADHIHILVGFRTNQTIGELMKQVKASSSKWLNETKYKRARFEWQPGYGVFSYSKSQVGKVRDYIKNQKEHHKKVSFKEEYILFLKKFGIDYDEKYIFHEPE